MINRPARPFRSERGTVESAPATLPTGTAEVTAEAGGDGQWNADAGNAQQGFDFTETATGGGALSLPDGHYKIEVYNGDKEGGAPGGAKQKVVWIECEAGAGAQEEDQPESVDVEKTADTDAVGADHFNGKRITYNILINRQGKRVSRFSAEDTVSHCPGFQEPEEVTSNDVGNLTYQIDGCTVRIQGDAKADVGNLVHLKVRINPSAAPVPDTVNNRVVVQINGQRDEDQVTLPVNQPEVTQQQEVAEAQVSVAGIQAGQMVTVPAGVPVFRRGEVMEIVGPAQVTVEGQQVTIPAGQVLVLGVQAVRQAPVTGVAGTYSSGYVWTVQPGDTLESIAAEYYGSPEYAWALYMANWEQLEQLVFGPGMVLVLP